LSNNNFENKQVLLILAAWFIFSFLVLWFIGGGCLSFLDGKSCISSGSFNWMSNIPILNLLMPFGQWSSLMYFLAPLVGFVLAFVLIKWWNSYFETKEASGILFFILIIIALIGGYYVNLFFYVNESAMIVTSRSGGQAKYSPYFCILETTDAECYGMVQKKNAEFIAQAQSGKITVVPQYIPISFWGEIRKSMYFLFILGAINAWIFLFATDLYKNFKESKD